MAEQPTIPSTPQPGQPFADKALEPAPHDTIAEVLDTLRSAQRHRDDMQSGVYVKLSESDLSSVITRLEQVAQHVQLKPLDLKKL